MCKLTELVMYFDKSIEEHDDVYIVNELNDKQIRSINDFEGKATIKMDLERQEVFNDEERTLNIRLTPEKVEKLKVFRVRLIAEIHQYCLVRKCFNEAVEGGLTDDEFNLIMGYLEGDGYLPVCIDGVLYRKNTECEYDEDNLEKELDEYSAFGFMDYVRESNFDLMADVRNEIMDFKLHNKLTEEQSKRAQYFADLTKDSLILDKIWERVWDRTK